MLKNPHTIRKELGTGSRCCGLALGISLAWDLVSRLRITLQKLQKEKQTNKPLWCRWSAIWPTGSGPLCRSMTSPEIYGAVLVSKLKSHFIVLVLHFMLYFSNLMLHQLHFHAVLRIDSENSFYEGTMVCQWCPIS